MRQRQLYEEDDIMHEGENEDAEIMKSIAFAEEKLGAHMATPTRV